MSWRTTLSSDLEMKALSSKVGAVRAESGGFLLPSSWTLCVERNAVSSDRRLFVEELELRSAWVSRGWFRRGDRTARPYHPGLPAEMLCLRLVINRTYRVHRRLEREGLHARRA